MCGRDGCYGAGGFQFRGSTRQAPAPKTITLDQGAYAVAPRPRPDAPFAKGARVFHQKFGYGTVVGVSEDKLEIDFDHSGSKKVMDSFVVPADKAG
ncbi:hypothetical protein [Azospirillum melinis]|uniref:hypothetical protein n=1 Tax=Azospirillum melinis TaxID=328839 RepID=UPI001FE4AB0F|nr:hypothetical protein [Azospirillum melinis]